LPLEPNWVRAVMRSCERALEVEGAEHPARRAVADARMAAARRIICICTIGILPALP
jgi:hypothetical protein